MTRKQACRRKQRKTRELPTIPRSRVLALAAAALVLVLTYQFSLTMLDRPIHAITIEGPFQRVSALQIEEAINDELDSGFLSANLGAIRQRVVALAWIDQATVTRRWPSQLVIAVTEQIPAACWGERGLLNTRGELFVTDARHVPAELPRLRGPESDAAEVAARYLKIRESLIPIGLDVRELSLDARGAWDMTLQNGVEIRLGRIDVENRTVLFLDLVADIVNSREAEIDFVDMRYSNGFTIGWKKGAGPATDDAGARKNEMVAGRAD